MKKIIIIVVAVLIPFVWRGLSFYDGFYSAPPSETPNYEKLITPIPPSTDYSDTFSKGEGTVLIDLAHDNVFGTDELNVLASRLTSRGMTVAFSAKAGRDFDLEKELTKVSAFIVVSPRAEFPAKERETVKKFTGDGGKLLLMADPTRESNINSIALEFGLIFEADYLYNMRENDANYRNIFVSEFGGGGITKDLTKIALYTAGSITSAGNGIAFVDANTQSSVVETRTKLSPIAQTNESKVLGIYDLTFMTEPYNGVLDNNRLISNIADWLASPGAKKAEAEKK